MTAIEDLNVAVWETVTGLAEHVAQLPPGEFTAAAPDLGGATIGQHVRHCLDHFKTLLAGLEHGRFDYDARKRDAAVELDAARAVAVARSLATELQTGLVDCDLATPVEVRTASGLAGKVSWQASSLGRELQFLVSHTVHHLAMVGASCRRRGLQVPADFGVAPSTLRYRTAAESPS